MAYGLSNGHVTDDVTWPQRCCEAVRSPILATAWLLVCFVLVGKLATLCTVLCTSPGNMWFLFSCCVYVIVCCY